MTSNEALSSTSTSVPIAIPQESLLPVLNVEKCQDAHDILAVDVRDALH